MFLWIEVCLLCMALALGACVFLSCLTGSICKIISNLRPQSG